MNTSKKNIVLFTNTVWNVKNFRMPIIQELKKLYKVHILIPQSNDELDIEGVNIEPLFYLNPDSLSPINEMLCLKEIRSHLLEIQPDLCMLFTIKPVIYGGYSCRKLRLKYISVVTGLGQIFINNGFINNLLRRFYFKSLKRATYVIVQNCDDKALLHRHIPNQKDVIEIPGSGIDSEFFIKGENQAESFTFLFLGRCLYEKGIEELRMAFLKLTKENGKVKLLIAGKWEGDNKRYINKDDWKSFISNPQVKFLRNIDNVKDIIDRSTVLVHPSYREGLSRSILEAMSMKLPVITTDAPGCRQLISNGINGWVVKSRDAESLNQAMQESIASSEKTLEEMGDLSRKRVLEQYNNENIVQDFLKVIKDIL